MKNKNEKNLLIDKIIRIIDKEKIKLGVAHYVDVDEMKAILKGLKNKEK